ncbi:hypothetical protein ECC02_008710 [Trypanosoma cruzi]|uniref:Uncharacterized protein n=1 Tax=Trypanosoma cruzi TaxID=5693 RepID=A0A7J6XV43_TRYCR|nr:hypothetical protein ECC02_008710 [Trypanosoma cruzi]
MDGSIGGELTPPQFIRAGVFMCRHIHRKGNGGPFLFRCTAGSTVATCVHRIGHMAHSTQFTIPAMHVHTKATESIILMLSLSTGSRTIPPHTHTHTHARDTSGCRHSEHTTHPPRASHPQENRLGVRAPSLLPFPHGHGRRQQPPHATANMHCKRSIQIHCNVHLVCVPAETQSKEVEKRKQSMWGDAKKCAAEVHGGSNKKKTAQTHDCTTVQAVAIHTSFIQNKKKQKKCPLHLTQTPSHKIIINKKEIVHCCSTQILKSCRLPFGHTKLSAYILPAKEN